MRKNMGISDKLKKVRTYQTQQKILSDWIKNWNDDQSQVIHRLRLAAQRDDHSEIMHMIDQLQGMTAKRFTGLNNAMRLLSDPDRQLKNLCSEDSNTVDDIPEPVPAPKRQHPIAAATDLNSRPPQSPHDRMEEIAKCYRSNMSIKEIADYNGIDTHKVVKILVTKGVYSSETYDRIKDLRIEGKSDDEIAKILSIKRGTMNDYTPYKKGIYKWDDPTENALKIRKCRGKNKINLDGQQ